MDKKILNVYITAQLWLLLHKHFPFCTLCSAVESKIINSVPRCSQRDSSLSPNSEVLPLLFLRKKIVTHKNYVLRYNFKSRTESSFYCLLETIQLFHY